MEVTNISKKEKRFDSHDRVLDKNVLGAGQTYQDRSPYSMTTTNERAV
jgi:hypothetical protein